ncbi:MAG: lysylphosphatidylglycerol synthase transmembrane domain-containing protein [Calditrichota bacterium]
MRYLKILISFGLSIFFLYLTFYVPHLGDLFRGEMAAGQALFGYPRFDLSQLGAAITSAHWQPIILTAILFVLSLLIRAWRWQIMLESITRMSFGNVFGAMCIGYMANNVLPFRMGEVYRAQVVYQISGTSRSAAFGSIVLERVTDLLFMLPYMALGFLLTPLPGAMRRSGIIISIAALVAALFIIWVAVDQIRAMAMVKRVLRVLPQKIAQALIGFIEQFTSGLGSLRTSKHLFAIITTSLAMWALYAAMVYTVMLSLGLVNNGIELIDRNPVGTVLVILIITTVGFVIPGAPGAVGTYHGVAVLGLSLFNVPGDQAAGFAILLHAMNYIPLTALGLFYFLRLGLTFHETNESVNRPIAQEPVASINNSET